MHASSSEGITVALSIGSSIIGDAITCCYQSMVATQRL